MKERLSLLSHDQNKQKELLEKGIISSASVSALRHRIAEHQGRLASLHAEKAALTGQIAELELDMERQSASIRCQVLNDIDLLDGQISEAFSQLLDIALRQEALKMRAPFAGHVHDLRITTVQTVLRGAEPAMAIVPVGSAMQVLVRVPPSDIDHIHKGQTVRVHLDGQGAEVWQEGRVLSLSADVFMDPARSKSYFEVEISLPNEGGAFDRDARLGMPVTAYFSTQPTNILSYLLAPVADYARKAFRDA